MEIFDFDLTEFVDRKVRVVCETNEEAWQFQRILHDLGFHWYAGQSLDAYIPGIRSDSSIEYYGNFNHGITCSTFIKKDLYCGNVARYILFKNISEPESVEMI